MKIMNRLFPEIKTDTNTDFKRTSNIQGNAEKTSNYDYETSKIKEIFDAEGIPLTDEKLEEVQTFLNETEGDLETKLETVMLAVEKDVEVSSDNLTRIHEAIHSPIDLAVEKMDMKTLKTMVKISDDTDTSEALETRVKLIVKSKLHTLLEPEVKPSDVEDAEPRYKNMEKDLEIRPRAQDKPVIINEQAVETIEASDITDDEAFLQDLEEVFENLGDHLDDLAEWLTPVANPELLIQDIPARKYLEVEVTTKMVEAKETFEMYQKAIDQSLSQALEPAVKVPVKEILTAVIDKLDHVIMKTDVPLYTDMKTERDLLSSSSELEKAKMMLDTDQEASIKIIKKVKDQVQALNFKPVRTKMYAVTQKAFAEKLYQEEMIKSVPLQVTDRLQTSPRAVLEMVRQLGLNHEPEVAERLQRDKEGFKLPSNMKSVLLKLEETHQRIEGKSNLDQLTGQQLLNKLEVKSQQQKMMLKVPVSIDGNVKQLKVHVNAKKDQQKIDWKNSRLYFVIHLDKLGDTGVLVDVKNGQAKVVIKNDTEGLEQKIKPFVDQGIKRLEEAGFVASTIKFETLSEQKTVEKVVDKEGFDVTI